jgi:hypothetical protein
MSEAKLAANRQNARKSTGPRTKEGKKRSSQNSLSHGIFCREVVLPGESQELFHTIRNSFLHTLSPQNLLELALVDEIAIATWKLRRLRDAQAVAHNDLSDLIKMKSSKRSSCEEDDQPIPACITTFYALRGDDDGVSERLAKHEQRLQRTIHRSLNELRKLRKDNPEDAPPQPCPYVQDQDPHLNPYTRAPDQTPESQDALGTAETPPPLPGGERAGVRGEPPDNQPAPSSANPSAGLPTSMGSDFEPKNLKNEPTASHNPAPLPPQPPANEPILNRLDPS